MLETPQTTLIILRLCIHQKVIGVAPVSHDLYELRISFAVLHNFWFGSQYAGVLAILMKHSFSINTTIHIENSVAATELFIVKCL